MKTPEELSLIALLREHKALIKHFTKILSKENKEKCQRLLDLSEELTLRE